MDFPDEDHLDKAKYISHYLVGTQNYSVVYDGKKGESLQAFTDSDWVSEDDSGISTQELIFQQDNDPKCTSKKAKKWMEGNDITLLDWPPQSPDLNPTEHLWNHIKQELSKYPTHAKGVWEIWERVEEVWNQISPEVCQNIIERKPRRLLSKIRK